ncbi:MAG: beta-N-acetylhexosaminidase [Bryobacteraceae bacterium]
MRCVPRHIPAALLVLLSAAALHGRVFPPPRELHATAGSLTVDESLTVLVPDPANAADRQLAALLTAELSERYGVAVRTASAASLPPGGPVVVMGTLGNPLVRAACELLNIDTANQETHPEGYLLRVTPRLALVAGFDEAGAFYGFQSLRQLIERRNATTAIAAVDIRDWPDKPFRGVKLYLPGADHIPYFRRFIRDFMALYKFNTAIVEMNAAMRLDHHPELNAGWVEFSRNMRETRRERSPGPGGQFQDSANADTADGGVLEKEQVAELVRYAREFHIEVIPEFPTLTHSYYLLTRHRELAEIQNAEWPDAYCPSNPATYDLVFSVLDEYIDVIHPRMMHVGHDEWRAPVGVCPRCRGKSTAELYARDLTRIHDHLRAKGVQTAIYGDHLIEALRGRGTEHHDNPGGVPYDTPGGLSAPQVESLVPKDILVFNWFWDDREKAQGEANDRALQSWGFRQVYANLTPEIQNYPERSRIAGVIGGAPSSWAATDERNFGKDLMFDFLGSAELLWSGVTHDVTVTAAAVQSLMPDVRRRMSGVPLPSDHAPVVALKLPFAALPAPISDVSTAIPVNADVSSIVFLHASAKPAQNVPAYQATWNYDDTAGLLGWYEIRYADGFVTTVPVRYGLHILESSWGANVVAGRTAYEAVAVNPPNGASGATFFAYEWPNPRLGKPVKSIRLVAAPGRTVLLAGVSVVKKKRVSYAENRNQASR